MTELHLKKQESILKKKIKEEDAKRKKKIMQFEKEEKEIDEKKRLLERKFSVLECKASLIRMQELMIASYEKKMDNLENQESNHCVRHIPDSEDGSTDNMNEDEEGSLHPCTRRSSESGDGFNADHMNDGDDERSSHSEESN